MIHLLAVAVIALALPLTALADAVLTSVRGDVRVGASAQSLLQARQDQRLTAGTMVTTGADAQAILRFDDGQRVLLNQNTEFRIVDYRFDEAQPRDDRSIFDILKGAARFVTGRLAQRNRNAFSLRAPQATIGIRGTDFMVAIVNPLYVNVTVGAIATSNAAGTVAFGAGAIGSIASSTALATPISASALPAGAAAAFSSMSAVSVGAVGGAAAGAEAAATGVAAGGVGTWAAVAIGAAAVAAAAAASSGGSTPQHTTTTTHTP